ncbi:ATP-binding cassette domain-containing protein [Oscillospiraceae bacterium OttesenSCG-928-G22]|nr:ATP-binding cassette domain-containing protein [Oscillospiraceae bacterium OttesenSCG-928-G22]
MAITVSNLTKTYGGKRVLHHFGMELAAGSVTCLMGPSGCGKTTLLHILLGILPYDAGTVSGLEGKRVSAVFQEDRLCENLSVLRNLLLVLPGKPDGAELLRELQAVGLAEDAKTPAGDLSGGMKRRVAILRALLVNPDVLILDEPFSGLDEDRKRSVMEYFKRKTEGKTVLFVTHDAEEAELLDADVITMSPAGE